MQQIIKDLTYMPKGHTGHLCPTKPVVDAWIEFYNICPFTNVLEFGFNTGWSSALLLTMFSNVKVSSIEIADIDSAKEGVKILEQKFPGRHSIVWGDSQKICKDVMTGKKKLPLDMYDLAFIDGGHWPEIVQKDIELSMYLGIKNFVFDDGNHPNIKPGIEKFKKLKLIKTKIYNETRYKNKRFIIKNRKIDLCYFKIS